MAWQLLALTPSLTFENAFVEREHNITQYFQCNGLVCCKFSKRVVTGI